MNELISVIIPVYNVEQYLPECVESVLKQTYQNLEILLIDDGSTDGSGKLCDEYAKKDSRVKVIHKENGGVSSARNRGLDIAQGEYITFIDGDDFVAENYVRALYENLKENGSDLAFCKYAFFNDNAVKASTESFPDKISVDINSEVFFQFFSRFISWKKNIMGSSCRILYRREVITNIRFNPQINIAEDLLFVLQVILKSKILSFINKELYLYRVNNQSAVHSYRKEFLKNQILLREKIKTIYSLFIYRRLEKLLNQYEASLCHGCFSNEIKFKPKNRKKNIEEIRKSKLYQHYTLKNIFRQGKLSVVIKFLVVWFLVKTRLV